LSSPLARRALQLGITSARMLKRRAAAMYGRTPRAKSVG